MYTLEDTKRAHVRKDSKHVYTLEDTKCAYVHKDSNHAYQLKTLSVHMCVRTLSMRTS